MKHAVFGIAAFIALIGCGDAPSGTDRCGGKCVDDEQCVPVEITVTGPQCGMFQVCKRPGNACVSPAKMTPLEDPLDGRGPQ